MKGGDQMAQKVSDVMTTRPRCANASTSVGQVAELMASEDVGAVPILDDDNKLVGIVTDRDIVVRAIALGKDPRGMAVRDISTTDPITIGVDDRLSDGLSLMADRQIRRLLVVDEDGAIVGMVAQADVALVANEKTTGALVEQISEPPHEPRAII
jgi:CBS domain-containing protein